MSGKNYEKSSQLFEFIVHKILFLIYNIVNKLRLAEQKFNKISQP